MLSKGSNKSNNEIWLDNHRNINIGHYEKVLKDELSIFNVSQFGALEGSCIGHDRYLDEVTCEGITASCLRFAWRYRPACSVVRICSIAPQNGLIEYELVSSHAIAFNLVS